MTAAGRGCGASAPLDVGREGGDLEAKPTPLADLAQLSSMTPFAYGCLVLRATGKLDMRDLPPPRRSESVIDWLVRAGIAESPQVACEGLLVARGLRELRDFFYADPGTHQDFAGRYPPCQTGAPEAQDQMPEASPTPTAALANGHGG